MKKYIKCINHHNHESHKTADTCDFKNEYKDHSRLSYKRRVEISPMINRPYGAI